MTFKLFLPILTVLLGRLNEIILVLSYREKKKKTRDDQQLCRSRSQIMYQESKQLERCVEYLAYWDLNEFMQLAGLPRWC